jgi:hypothetical protein
MARRTPPDNQRVSSRGLNAVQLRSLCTTSPNLPAVTRRVFEIGGLATIYVAATT